MTSPINIINAWTDIFTRLTRRIRKYVCTSNIVCDGRTKARGVVKDATLTSPSVVCKSVFRVVTLSNLPTLPPGYLWMFTHFGKPMHSLRTILIYNRSVSLRSEPLVVVQYNTARSTVNARKLCLINS